MTETLTSDTGALRLLYLTIYNNDVISNMVDEEIHSGLPEEQVINHLAGSKLTCVSVNLPSTDASGRVASKYSRIVEKRATFWIDVISRNGESDAYCRSVASAIEDLISLDDIIDADYGILVWRVITNISRNETWKAWHAALQVQAEYTIRIS